MRLLFLVLLAAIGALATTYVVPRDESTPVTRDVDEIFPPDSLQVNYVDPITPEAQAAVEYALQIIDDAIQACNGVPVRIDFKWADQGAFVLGRAGPNAVIPKGANAEGEGHALSMLVGTMGTYAVSTAYLLPSSEITATFNKAYPSWYYGTDGKTPRDKCDFVSVLLHEFIHGLGFAGSFIRESPNNTVARLNPKVADDFDAHLYSPLNAAGQQVQPFPLNDMLNQPDKLYTLATNQNVKFKAGANLLPIYSPSPWGMSQLYHFNDPSQIMNPSVMQGATKHVLKNELLVLSALGWPLKSPKRDVRAPPSPPQRTSRGTDSTSFASASSTGGDSTMTSSASASTSGFSSASTSYSGYSSTSGSTSGSSGYSSSGSTYGDESSTSGYYSSASGSSSVSSASSAYSGYSSGYSSSGSSSASYSSSGGYSSSSYSVSSSSSSSYSSSGSSSASSSGYSSSGSSSYASRGSSSYSSSTGASSSGASSGYSSSSGSSSASSSGYSSSDSYSSSSVSSSYGSNGYSSYSSSASYSSSGGYSSSASVSSYGSYSSSGSSSSYSSSGSSSYGASSASYSSSGYSSSSGNSSSSGYSSSSGSSSYSSSVNSSSSSSVSSSGSSSSSGGSAPTPPPSPEMKMDVETCPVRRSILNSLSKAAGAKARASVEPCKGHWQRDLEHEVNERETLEELRGTTLTVTFDTEDTQVYDKVAKFVRSDPPELKSYRIKNVKVVTPPPPPPAPQTTRTAGSGSGSGSSGKASSTSKSSSGSSSSPSSAGPAPSPSGSSKTAVGLVVGIVIGVAVVLFLVGGVGFYLLYHMRKSDNRPSGSEDASVSYTLLN